MKQLALLFAFTILGSAQVPTQTSPLNLGLVVSALGGSEKPIDTVRFTSDDGGYVAIAKDGTLTYANGATPESMVRLLIDALLSEFDQEKQNAKADEKKFGDCMSGFQLAIDAYKALRLAIGVPAEPAKEKKHENDK